MSSPITIGGLYSEEVDLLNSMRDVPFEKLTNEHVDALYRVYQGRSKPGLFTKLKRLFQPTPSGELNVASYSALASKFGGKVENITAGGIYEASQRLSGEAEAALASGAASRRSSYRRPTALYHRKWVPYAKLSKNAKGVDNLVAGRIPALSSPDQMKRFSKAVKGFAIADFGFRVLSGQDIIQSAMSAAVFSAVSTAFPGVAAAYMLNSFFFESGRSFIANHQIKLAQRATENSMAVQRFTPTPTKDTAAALENRAAAMNRISIAQAERFSSYSVSRKIHRQAGSTSEVWS